MVDIYKDIRSFIIHKLRINAGSQVGIEAPSKEEIVSFCDKQGIETKGLTKEQLINQINEMELSTELLINSFKSYLGIHSSEFQKKFNIDHKTVKKLENKGLLPVVYKQRTRAFGKYLYVPMYSAIIYFGTNEEFQKLLDAAI